ncbi:hypothetical protein RZO55_00675 [Clostridium boliviensis]|uniref:Uncharacterized protein n=1 Tax=Clostridium boliviensis TaxID=318465 RepID=A0ABU4GEQ3_9CLOT|nr:hypothetical protein [Clostridium boliviensis]MDW2796100.1 hypothetical protein [Clostridium boliviensis]
MRKLIASILTIAICLTSFNSTIAFAATNETNQEMNQSLLSLKKSNFNYLEGKPGDTHLVYTYESNNDKYKVIENASDNFEKVNTTIYVENTEGVFVKYATQTLTINNFTSTLSTNENGYVTTEKQDLSSVKKSELLNNNFISSALASGSYQGYKVSNWKQISTTNSSTRITNYSATAVFAIIAYIAADGATEGLSGAVVAAISAVAGKIIDEAIPIVYYRQIYSEKKLINPPLALRNFVVGSKWLTYFYSDKSHSQFIRSVTDIVYANGYEE